MREREWCAVPLRKRERMIPTALANRYARALVDVAFPQGVMDTVFDELKGFQALVAASSDLHEVVANPTIQLSQKQAVLAQLATRLKLHPITTNFLTVLMKNQRLMYLDAVVEAVGRDLDVRRGVVAAEVTTAAPLADDKRAALLGKLKSATGKDVRVTFQTDPALIGGVVTRIGSRIYDGSIRSQLDSFREQLSRG